MKGLKNYGCKNQKNCSLYKSEGEFFEIPVSKSQKNSAVYKSERKKF